MRLLHLLTIAALLLMPLGMTGGEAMAAAQDAPAAAAMDHCDDAAGKAPRRHSSPDADCMAACAAIPAAGSADFAAPLAFATAIEASPIAGHGKGLGPEAAIPPPRLS